MVMASVLHDLGSVARRLSRRRIEDDDDDEGAGVVASRVASARVERRRASESALDLDRRSPGLCRRTAFSSPPLQHRRSEDARRRFVSI